MASMLMVSQCGTSLGFSRFSVIEVMSIEVSDPRMSCIFPIDFFNAMSGNIESDNKDKERDIPSTFGLYRGNAFESIFSSFSE